MKEIFSSGGGTQSTAIAVLIIKGILPKPDMVVIADTGRECSETWRYLDAIVKPALLEVGVEVYRVGREWFNMPVHRKDYLSHNGNTLLIGAWTSLTGKPGKLTGFCSVTWKSKSIDRYLSRQHGIKRAKMIKWIGFSMDEWKRAQRIMVSEDGKRGLIRLPLVQDFPLTRQEAIREAVNMGWPMPPRSRCWMCPNQADDEWMDLKINYPEEFLKAVLFEKEMQEFDPFAWLHKLCIPLEDIDFSKKPTLFDSTQYCDSGICFV